jgi:tagatose-1,6-bisphosphate aldolase
LLQIYALNYFTGLAKGEIASLSGAGDDPRYFQISVVFADGHHAAGQMAGRASSAGG